MRARGEDSSHTGAAMSRRNEALGQVAPSNLALKKALNAPIVDLGVATRRPGRAGCRDLAVSRIFRREERTGLRPGLPTADRLGRR
jgi:hypothetical protein